MRVIFNLVKCIVKLVIKLIKLTLFIISVLAVFNKIKNSLQNGEKGKVVFIKNFKNN